MALENDDHFGVFALALAPDDCSPAVLGMLYYCTCSCRLFRGKGCFGQNGARLDGRVDPSPCDRGYGVPAKILSATLKFSTLQPAGAAGPSPTEGPRAAHEPPER